MPGFHYKKDARLQLIEHVMETVCILRGEKGPDVCTVELTGGPKLNCHKFLCITFLNDLGLISFFSILNWMNSIVKAIIKFLL